MYYIYMYTYTYLHVGSSHSPISQLSGAVGESQQWRLRRSGDSERRKYTSSMRETHISNSPYCTWNRCPAKQKKEFLPIDHIGDLEHRVLEQWLFCYLFIQVSLRFTVSNFDHPSPKACMAAAKELEKEQEAWRGDMHQAPGMERCWQMLWKS